MGQRKVRKARDKWHFHLNRKEMLHQEKEEEEEEDQTSEIRTEMFKVEENFQRLI